MSLVGLQVGATNGSRFKTLEDLPGQTAALLRCRTVLAEFFLHRISAIFGLSDGVMLLFFMCSIRAWYGHYSQIEEHHRCLNR